MTSEQFMQERSLDKESVFSIVVSYVSEFFFVENKTLVEEIRFEEDLCVDSFIFADFLDALEEEFTERGLGFRLDEKERSEIETLGDLAELICGYVLDPLDGDNK